MRSIVPGSKVSKIEGCGERAWKRRAVLPWAAGRAGPCLDRGGQQQFSVEEREKGSRLVCWVEGTVWCMGRARRPWGSEDDAQQTMVCQPFPF